MTDTAETRRQMGDLIRLAAVASVEGRSCMVRLAEGSEPLGPYPWLVGAAGETCVWSAPSVGEQIILLCPEADAEAGVVMRGLYSTAFPAPASDAVEMIRFKDGAVLHYDPVAHRLDVALPDGGVLAIAGDVEIAGDVSLDGQLGATGKISSDDDVLAGETSLKNHRHLGVQTGPGVSGPPQ